jgi:dipeptidyl-peptidase 4
MMAHHFAASWSGCSSRKRSLGAIFAASIVMVGAQDSASAQQPANTPSPNYQAADRFAPANLRPFLYDTAINPHWIGKTDHFWYSFRTSEGTNYYRVNPRNATKELLFDRDKLANQLSSMVQKPLEPALLPIERLVLNDEGTKIRFVFEESRYEYDLTSEALTKLGKVQANPLRGLLGAGGGGGGGRGRGVDGENGRRQEEQWDEQQGRGQNQNQNQQQQRQEDGQNQNQQIDQQREQQVVEEGRRQDGDGQVRVNQQLQDGQQGQGQGQGQGPGGRGGLLGYRTASPDGKSVVFARNHNLFIAETGKEDAAVALSTDGVEDYSFATGGFGQGARGNGNGNGNGTGTGTGTGNAATPPPFDPNRKVRAAVTWSPDSKAFFVTRSDGRGVKDLFVINSLAEPRPTLEKYKYAMPGEEEIRRSELYVYNASTKALTKLPIKWKDETYTQVHWRKTANDLRFVRRDRLIRHLEFCSMDVPAGTSKCLISEGFENATLDFRPARYLDETNEMIWWSERTGWGHFYLYDQDGKLKNAITVGPYRAATISEVDIKNRLLYFTANGREPKENIYLQHLYRVNLDGTGLALMDPGSANHRSIMSPTRQFLVDNASRVDLAPTAVVRAADGHEVMALEKTDLSGLVESGWKLPETFVVKAADGVTDLYGNMWKPFDFDPKKSYPIIVHVYPGPQQEGTTHTFTASSGEQQLAQVGFIVIQVGHRGGTPTRSKAYHSFGYFNLRDYGLADKKAAVEQLAARHPFININKVGIYGHSGGGFMTAAAMMQKPFNDFFKVGVSTSGNHDNNIYGSYWAETYHGLKEVVPGTDAKKETIPPTRAGRGGRTANGDPIEGIMDDEETIDRLDEVDLDLLIALEQEQQADDEKAAAEKKAAEEKKASEEKKATDDKKAVDEKKAAEDKKASDEKKAADDKKAAEAKMKFEIHVPTNAELADNLKGRLLLVHGELDNNVHPANTLRLVDALIKANKRFDMLYLPGKRHAYADYQNYVNQRMMEYFAEHLLGDYQPTANLGDKSPFKKGD